MTIANNSDPLNQSNEDNNQSNSNAYEDVLEKLGLEEKEDKPFWAKFLK